MERADAHQDCVRLRTGDQTPEAAHLRANRRLQTAVTNATTKVNEDFEARKFFVSFVTFVVWISLCRALPDHTSHEERAEVLEIERRLLCLAHRLDDLGQGIQILADQPDDEIVIVPIETVT